LVETKSAVIRAVYRYSVLEVDRRQVIQDLELVQHLGSAVLSLEPNHH
jgi:hypothetical protein